jgi:hypothetical protein
VLKWGLAVLAIVGGVTQLAAEEGEDQGASIKPKTRLEAFVAQDGVVIVRGFSKAGAVKGGLGTSVKVELKEFANASTGKKEYGITVEVGSPGARGSHTSYIDQDEIGSLLKGIAYIAKLDKSVTSLESFQADYRTRGDLRLSTYSNSNGQTEAAVASGLYGGTTAYLSLADLEQLRTILQSASESLDKLRGPTK